MIYPNIFLNIRCGQIRDGNDPLLATIQIPSVPVRNAAAHPQGALPRMSALEPASQGFVRNPGAGEHTGFTGFVTDARNGQYGLANSR